LPANQRKRKSAKVSAVKVTARASSVFAIRSLVPIAIGRGPMTSTAPPSSLRAPFSADRAMSSAPAAASANPSAKSARAIDRASIV